MVKHLIRYHYSTAPNFYIFSFIVTLDTFSAYLEENYVQLNLDVEMNGFTKESLNQLCPRCFSNSNLMQSDFCHSADCTYFLNTFSCTAFGNIAYFDGGSAVTTLTTYDPSKSYNDGSQFKSFIQQMYDSTCQYVQLNPMSEKLPPPFCNTAVF